MRSWGRCWALGVMLGGVTLAGRGAEPSLMDALMEVESALQQARMALLQSPEVMPRHERLLNLGGELHTRREARLTEVPGMAEKQAEMRALLGRLARIAQDETLSDEQRIAARAQIMDEIRPLSLALGEARRSLPPDAELQALQDEADALSEEVQTLLSEALKADPETAALLRERERLTGLLQQAEAEADAADPDGQLIGDHAGNPADEVE